MGGDGSSSSCISMLWGSLWSPLLTAPPSTFLLLGNLKPWTDTELGAFTMVTAPDGMLAGRAPAELGTMPPTTSRLKTSESS